MKKVIRLTERDLTRLVKRVVYEQRLLNEDGICVETGDRSSIEEIKNAVLSTKPQGPIKAEIELMNGTSCVYLSVNINGKEHNVLL